MKITQAQRRKLDFDPVEQKGKYLSIFVRFSDQIVRRGPDYDVACERYEKVPRSELRIQVLNLLKQKSETSWQRVGTLVEGLLSKKEIRAVKRFWIVNGFACDATLEACVELAKQRSIEYIYLQPDWLSLHRDKKQKFDRVRAKKLMEKTLKNWRDDSDDAFSPRGSTIPWNVRRVQADQVWKKEGLTGRGVVVGVIDSGLYPVPSLANALWRNPGEVINGRDDTGSGYVDDVFGYNFSTQAFNVLNMGPQDYEPHGAMCCGIIAGRANNDLNMQTGLAPRSRLMILKDSSGKLEAYEYAVAHGADIISMSYTLNRTPLGNFRGIFRLAHEHMSLAGVLSVGGAGNYAKSHPVGHQVGLPKSIPCVIAAGGIRINGKLASFSSRGPCYWDDVKFYEDYPQSKPLLKPDVTAMPGGFPVWSVPVKGTRFEKKGGKTLMQYDKYAAISTGARGNSFSGPHAAGIAALMLEANPDLHAWQVKHMMQKTCKKLSKRPNFEYGHGLIQGLDAVRAVRKLK